MNTIDKYNAPRGYIAVPPEEFSHDSIGECSDCLKKSLDNLPAAWKVFQQYKEAANTLHS